VLCHPTEENLIAATHLRNCMETTGFSPGDANFISLMSAIRTGIAYGWYVDVTEYTAVVSRGLVPDGSTTLAHLNILSIRQQFATIDKDQSGTADEEEIIRTLINSGYSADQAYVIFSTADSDGSGAIGLYEFASVIQRGQLVLEDMRVAVAIGGDATVAGVIAIVDLFESYDADKNGTVTLVELSEGLVTKGIERPLADLLANVLDLDGSNSIELDEFAMAIHRQLLPSIESGQTSHVTERLGQIQSTYTDEKLETPEALSAYLQKTYSFTTKQADVIAANTDYNGDKQISQVEYARSIIRGIIPTSQDQAEDLKPLISSFVVFDSTNNNLLAPREFKSNLMSFTNINEMDARFVLNIVTSRGVLDEKVLLADFVLGAEHSLIPVSESDTLDADDMLRQAQHVSEAIHHMRRRFRTLRGRGPHRTTMPISRLKAVLASWGYDDRQMAPVIAAADRDKNGVIDEGEFGNLVIRGILPDDVNSVIERDHVYSVQSSPSMTRLTRIRSVLQAFLHAGGSTEGSLTDTSLETYLTAMNAPARAVSIIMGALAPNSPQAVDFLEFFQAGTDGLIPLNKVESWEQMETKSHTRVITAKTSASKLKELVSKLVAKQHVAPGAMDLYVFAADADNDGTISPEDWARIRASGINFLELRKPARMNLFAAVSAYTTYVRANKTDEHHHILNVAHSSLVQGLTEQGFTDHLSEDGNLIARLVAAHASEPSSVSLQNFVSVVRRGLVPPTMPHQRPENVHHRVLQLQREFSLYDDSGDGIVDVDEMTKTMTQWGHFTEEQAALMFGVTDSSKDGIVTFEEFALMVQLGVIPMGRLATQLKSPSSSDTDSNESSTTESLSGSPLVDTDAAHKLLQAFLKLANPSTGENTVVSRAAFESALKRDGLDADLSSVIASAADVQGDGTISYDEYMLACQAQLCPAPIVQQETLRSTAISLRLLFDNMQTSAGCSRDMKFASEITSSSVYVSFATDHLNITDHSLANLLGYALYSSLAARPCDEIVFVRAAIFALIPASPQARLRTQGALLHFRDAHGEPSGVRFVDLVQHLVNLGMTQEDANFIVRSLLEHPLSPERGTNSAVLSVQDFLIAARIGVLPSSTEDPTITARQFVSDIRSALLLLPAIMPEHDTTLTLKELQVIFADLGYSDTEIEIILEVSYRRLAFERHSRLSEFEFANLLIISVVSPRRQLTVTQVTVTSGEQNNDDEVLGDTESGCICDSQAWRHKHKACPNTESRNNGKTYCFTLNGCGQGRTRSWDYCRIQPDAHTDQDSADDAPKLLSIEFVGQDKQVDLPHAAAGAEVTVAVMLKSGTDVTRATPSAPQGHCITVNGETVISGQLSPSDIALEVGDLTRIVVVVTNGKGATATYVFTIGSGAVAPVSGCVVQSIKIDAEPNSRAKLSKHFNPLMEQSDVLEIKVDANVKSLQITPAFSPGACVNIDGHIVVLGKQSQHISVGDQDTPVLMTVTCDEGEREYHLLVKH